MKILSICGSPRQGNSETILLYLKERFAKNGHENDIILLRQKNINRCHGCVEFCNPVGICCQHDDVPLIIDQMCQADAFVFISPNYFQMPTGLLKDFMDRSCVILASKKDKILNQKKAIVIAIGTDDPAKTNVCADNIAKLYLRYLCPVVATKSFRTRSELKGNLNDVFENGFNPNIKQDLEELATRLTQV